jgi:hypothetical protein
MATPREEQPMDESAARPEGIFDDRRQAAGWLTMQWAAYLAGIVAMIAFLVGSPGLAGGIVVLAAAIVLLAAMGWGWRARSGLPRVRMRAAAAGLPWWRRDSYVAERAATTLGWDPAIAVWVNRVLIAAGIVLLVATLAALIVRGAA